MKKNILIITLAAMMGLTAHAQQAIFLFDDFTEAEIGFARGGKPVKALFNFDANGQKLYYMQGEQMMEMTNSLQIDTLKADGRTFVWKNGKFCELILQNGNEIFINWHFTESFVGKEGAFGLTTQGKAESYYVPGLNSESSFENASRYENKTDIWKRKCDNTYYFTCRGKTCKARRIQELYKSYPECKDELKAFAKKGNLMMLNAEDAIKIISYLYTL